MEISRVKDYDKKMLSFACSFGNLSKDYSTKVGFILLRPGQNSPSIFSYNGLVTGANDSCEIRAKTRPEKYLWGEHAERNGLYEVARPLLKDTMVFCAKFPNMDSARAIIVTGIDLVITDFVENLHYDYLKLVSEQNKTGKNIADMDFSEEVKSYARVREFFRENNVTLYHPSRKLLEQGRFLSGDERRTYESYNNNPRFLRKSVELLDQVIRYADLFSRRNYKDAAFIVRKETFKSVSMGAHNVPEDYDVFMTEEKENEVVFGKNMWYIEAVKDAIYNVLRPQLLGSKAYVSLCPCLDCAMALNAVGVKKLVTLKPDFSDGVGKRWEEHFSRTQKFYKEINMDAIYFTDSDILK